MIWGKQKEIAAGHHGHRGPLLHCQLPHVALPPIRQISRTKKEGIGLSRGPRSLSSVRQARASNPRRKRQSGGQGEGLLGGNGGRMLQREEGLEGGPYLYSVGLLGHRQDVTGASASRRHVATLALAAALLGHNRCGWREGEKWSSSSATALDVHPSPEERRGRTALSASLSSAASPLRALALRRARTLSSPSTVV